MLANILAILNLVLPAIGSIVVAIRGKNGGMSAVVYLDEADAQFAANQQQIADWLSSKGKTPVS